MGPMTALYGLAHFWVDLSCALLVLGTMAGRGDFALCLLLYNFCAFALQMPLGLAADRLGRNGAVAAAGCVLTATAFVPPPGATAAVAAGVGNALFHLGGGMDVLGGSRGRAAALGVFVSPGALGLYVGTLWGRSGSLPLWPVPLVLLALGAAIQTLRPRRTGNPPPSLEAPAGYAPLAPLFLVVVLRSYMGLNQAFPWKGTGCWAAALTLALVLGKAAGGFLMDMLGPRRASLVSLGLAGALYLLSGLPLPGTLAVFLFNMTMPITLWAAVQALPGARGFAFGALTYALFLGFLPGYLGWPSLLEGPASYAAAALVSLALLLPPLRRLERGARRC